MFKEIFRKFKSDNQPKYGWFGNYLSWAAVLKEADGYDSGVILERTKNSLLKVKAGKAVYERDSVVFDKREYPFALISFLQHSALKKREALHIIDFGGSLGSTYYQIKDFLTPNVCLSWNVIEQEHYVATGKVHFEDKLLKFYDTIDQCIEDKRIDFVLLSSSVQYLEEPHVFLKKLAAYRFDFILFDRTAFHAEANDRLTLQVVPPVIYPASYPAWFFNQEKLLDHFTEGYDVVADFPPYVEGEQVLYIDEYPSGYSKGFYLSAKSRNQ
jgi:putative methyltransferase (TIGR04325 family)